MEHVWAPRYSPAAAATRDGHGLNKRLAFEKTGRSDGTPTLGSNQHGPAAKTSRAILCSACAGSVVENPTSRQNR